MNFNQISPAWKAKRRFGRRGSQRYYRRRYLLGRDLGILEEGAIVSETLEQVRDALHRLQAGSYGTCTVCGRHIEHARLEAVPWTPYWLGQQITHEIVARDSFR